MANFDVRHILVDQGSFVDIMYSQMFTTLQLDESHLTPYVGSYLQGFNDTVTKLWGFIEQIVSLGAAETVSTMKVQFVVVHYPSKYQCIFGRPNLVELIDVAPIVYLRMKYYTAKG